MKKTWVSLRCILLSERIQFENDSNYMTFWNRQNIESVKYHLMSGVWGEVERVEQLVEKWDYF